MILGMDWLTLLHALVSLVGLLTGLVVLLALVAGRNPEDWASWFLSTTLLATVTGFFFRHEQVTLSELIGIVSLAALVLGIYALYGRGLAGSWRGIYVVAATLVLYLNVFILVVQAFEKISVLHAIAPGIPPTGSTFIMTQLAVLAVFLLAGWRAYLAFKPMKF